MRNAFGHNNISGNSIKERRTEKESRTEKERRTEKESRTGKEKRTGKERWGGKESRTEKERWTGKEKRTRKESRTGKERWTGKQRGGEDRNRYGEKGRFITGSRTGKKHRIPKDTGIQGGLFVEDGILGKEENRLYTLLLKGVLIFLLTAGGLGGFLSSVGLLFYKPVFYIGLFLISMICGLFYYNRYTKFLGYPALTAAAVYGCYRAWPFVLDGLIVIINHVTSILADYLDVELADLLLEPYPDKIQSVTAAALFCGSIACVLTSLVTVRRMKYLRAVCIGLIFFYIPFYMEMEPDLLSMVMMAAGISALYLYRRNGYYRVKTYKTRYSPDQKGRLRCSYYFRAQMSVFLWAGAIIGIVFSVLAVLLPAGRFHEYLGVSKWKQKELALLKEETDPNARFAVGGLNDGQLGTVSRIALDGKTDLFVRFAPWNMETVYLKSFTGREYIPYENRWEADENPLTLQEAQRLKKAFQTDEAYASAARIRVKNIAAPAGKYLPYYADDQELAVERDHTEYYLFFPGRKELILDLPQPGDLTLWLQIPQKNREVLERFCREAGLGPVQETAHGEAAGVREETAYGEAPSAESEVRLLADRLGSYFQEKIPYTLSPGATPSERDFINYFLSENQMGYCTHFASAAVMVFRYYGIPARYVEGYAIPYSKTLEGETVEKAKYGAYYSGYSELGEKPVIRVDVTDAEAHAWVEAWDSRYGWQVVDVTPSAWEEDEPEINRLFDFLNQNILNSSGWDSPQPFWSGGSSWSPREFPAVWKEAAALLAAVLAVWILRRYVAGISRYLRAGRSDRLIILYSAFLSRQRKRFPQLEQKLDYREQLARLGELKKIRLTGEEMRRLEDILTAAGFSGKEISAEEFQEAAAYLRLMKR